VRVPSGKEMPLMFGNAIHNALSMFYAHFKETGEKSCDYLLSAFEKSAEAQEFTKDELGDVLVRGKEILLSYFKNYEDNMSRNVRVKYRVVDARLQINDDDIKLTGEVDLINYLDNSLSNIEVVDFKTGRAKTRNDILGKTKNADGNYYRQLVFYKILLSITQPKWNIKLATLDFVEPDKSGKFHRESFDVTDEEVEELKKIIEKSSQEISTLSFWESKCDNQTCEWCALRASLEEKQFEGGLF